MDEKKGLISATKCGKAKHSCEDRVPFQQENNTRSQLKIK